MVKQKRIFETNLAEQSRILVLSLLSNDLGKEKSQSKKNNYPYYQLTNLGFDLCGSSPELQ